MCAGFGLDFGWTLQLLPRRRQDPSIQKASQSDDKKRPKMKPKIGENRLKIVKKNRCEIDPKWGRGLFQAPESDVC